MQPLQHEVAWRYAALQTAIANRFIISCCYFHIVHWQGGEPLLRLHITAFCRLRVAVAVRRRTVVDSRDYSCNKEQVQSLWRILYTSCGFLNALKYIFDELFQIVKTETLIYTQNMGSKPPECIFTEIDCISLHVTGFTLNLHWFSLRCTSLQY